MNEMIRAWQKEFKNRMQADYIQTLEAFEQALDDDIKRLEDLSALTSDSS